MRHELLTIRDSCDLLQDWIGAYTVSSRDEVRHYLEIKFGNISRHFDFWTSSSQLLFFISGICLKYTQFKSLSVYWEKWAFQPFQKMHFLTWYKIFRNKNHFTDNLINFLYALNLCEKIFYWITQNI